MRTVSSRLFTLLLVPGTLAVFACKGNDAKNVDSALNNDLSLAAHPGTLLDSVSAAERGVSPTGAGTRSAPAHHTYRSSSRGSSGASQTSQGPTYHTEKHTGRDAAIGAGAGAILGAVTSKNKAKGAIIGGAAGGILGAVIGNNVDKQKVPNP